MALKRISEDTPKIAKRREHDKRVVSLMVALYCHDNHGDRPQNIRAYCNELLCEECAAIEQYSVKKTEDCRMMETKISCEECEIHCYTKAEREAIRTVMRYSGPRMMFHHPVEAIRHLMKR